MADRNTKLRKGQISSDSVEPTDLDALNSPSAGQIPAVGSGGQFEWVDQTGGSTLITLNTQTDDYTLVLTDKDKLIDMNKETALTLTIPKNSVVAFDIGTKIALRQKGVGALSVAPIDGDVTINESNGLTLTAQYSIAWLIKVATDTWTLYGELGTTGVGDMLKSTYDIDDDGIVDKAENVDDGASGGIHSSSAVDVRDAVDKKHASESDNQTADTVSTDDSGISVQDALDALEIKEGFNEGLLSNPTIIDASGLNINVSSVDVLIRSDINFPDYLYKFTVPADTSLEVTDNNVNYIYVNYESGSPIYKASINREDINNSNHIPVARVYIKDGNIEYQLSYEFVGRSASIRIFDRLMRTTGNTGIVRESGLAITEIGTRVVTIASGIAWLGIHRIILDTIVMGETGIISELYYHSSGNWTETYITAYNNTQYDNGTDLVTLTAGRYAVNWVYRNIYSNEMDIVLGNGDYTLAQATASMIPSLPTQIANFYVLCGRIIIKKGESTAYAIENVADVSFRTSAVTIHNDLASIQGGQSNEYYHLTSAKHTVVDNTSGVNTGDQIASTVPTDESGVSVQDKLIELENAVPEVDDFTIINNAGVLKVADRIEQNIMLLAFYRSVDQSKSVYNLIDGLIDEYEDETGIDTGASTNELYNSSLDCYSPYQSANVEVDYMEYASNALARAAYVSSDFIPAGIDSYTKLMLHLNGVDGSTTITDDSGNNHNGTCVGNAQLDTDEKKFGTASLLTDGTGDYVNISDSDDFAFGTGDFTIDFWVRFNVVDTYVTFISQTDSTSNYYQFVKNGNYLRIYIASTAGVGLLDYQVSWTPIADTWYHLALVRYNNDWMMFENGTQLGTTNTTSLTFPDYNGLIYIAAFPSGTDNLLNGRMDEVRISKGIARWTSNFTPLTSEYSDEDSGNLLIYSEDTIKQQGSYSLKATALITDSLNDTLTKTLASGSHIDLSGYNTIKLDVRASRTGQNLQLQIHDSGGTTSTYNITVNSANTWETKSWDISGISDANKNDIDSIIIKVNNADVENTFYFDNVYAEGIYQNMTLIANEVTAESEPANARIVLFEQDVDAITLNTDLKAWVSIDNGSNYDQITLTDEGDWETGKRVISGLVDVSARTGTTIKYKITTHNNKNLNLHGTAVSWA